MNWKKEMHNAIGKNDAKTVKSLLSKSEIRKELREISKWKWGKNN